ncbi:hypothetical protein [Halodesulfovibrio sp.]|jgi:outer membrane PBP1 activator LpoA protein|uniref:hypothetical protein n=1 Tax=Halodesulfovibrio sp. TaxID=1912772 RepID=UPI0025E28EA7|nr:hypothetical protein [Halodesulfovibrio sp.]MCT4533752.1 hypothetical protein [Halodesulfovibrio sp.]
MKKSIVYCLLILVSSFCLFACSNGEEEQKIVQLQKEQERQSRLYEVKEIGESDLAPATNNF